MRRVKVAVPLDECKLRCVSAMQQKPSGTIFRASQLAYYIWPGTNFKAQGAGAAASRILRRLQTENIVKFVGDRENWGYALTGRALTPPDGKGHQK